MSPLRARGIFKSNGHGCRDVRMEDGGAVKKQQVQANGIPRGPRAELKEHTEEVGVDSFTVGLLRRHRSS